MLRLFVEAVLFVLVAGTVVVAAVNLFKQTVVAWWRGQKAFPHLRDPVVMVQDQIEADLKAAELRYERAEADVQIAAKDQLTYKKQLLANKKLENLYSGQIDDEVVKEVNAKAAELEEIAAKMRAGQIGVEDINIGGPVPDLSDDSDRERGKNKNKVR